jgi:hypothetical protein
MRILLAVFFAGLVSAQTPSPKFERPAPEQPLPFSHKTHLSLKLQCKQCHVMPDPGDFATLPATSICMNCHVAVKKDSPHIAKLTAYHSEGKKVPWVRVYRIPEYVFFNHAKHIAVDGVSCETCHGPVAQRDVLRREKEVSMQACMDCHRAKGARNECTFCHDQK